jgi:hypothetical protein
MKRQGTRLLIRLGSRLGLILRNLEISLRTGGSLVRRNQIKTRLRVTPLTERERHDKDHQHDRYGDHDYDFACPYGQRHGHGLKDTGPPAGLCAMGLRGPLPLAGAVAERDSEPNDCARRLRLLGC